MELILWFVAGLIIGHVIRIALYGKISFHKHEWKLDAVHKSPSIYSDKKEDHHYIYTCKKYGCKKFVVETQTVLKEKNEH